MLLIKKLILLILKIIKNQLDLLIKKDKVLINYLIKVLLMFGEKIIKMLFNILGGVIYKNIKQGLKKKVGELTIVWLIMIMKNMLLKLNC